ncbi:unnamed protein product [Merluccius merluccius]
MRICRGPLSRRIHSPPVKMVVHFKSVMCKVRQRKKYGNCRLVIPNVDDESITVLEFFKLFDIDFVIHNPRQSILPGKEEQQKLREKLEEADGMLKGLDDCIQELETELENVTVELADRERVNEWTVAERRANCDVYSFLYGSLHLELLHDVGLVVSRCRLLSEELRLLKTWGSLKFDILDIRCVDTRVHIVFSSLEAMAKFELSLGVTAAYPWCPLHMQDFKSHIGATTLSHYRNRLSRGAVFHHIEGPAVDSRPADQTSLAGGRLADPDLGLHIAAVVVVILSAPRQRAATRATSPKPAAMEDISTVEVEPCTSSNYLKPFRLHYNQNGTRKSWDFMRTHDSVSVLIFNTTSHCFVLVKQFRPAVYMCEWERTKPQPPEPAEQAEEGGAAAPASTTSTTTAAPSTEGPTATTATTTPSESSEGQAASEEEGGAAAASSRGGQPPAAAGVTYELCAGLVDKPQLSLEEIARQEVLEECGYDVPVAKLRRITSYRSGVGVTGAKQTMFYAEVSEENRVGEGGGEPQEGELIEVVKVPLHEAMTFAYDETIPKTMGVIFSFIWFHNNMSPKYKISTNV